MEYNRLKIKEYGGIDSDLENIQVFRCKKSGEVLEKEIDFKLYVVELILKLKSLGFIVANNTSSVRYVFEKVQKCYNK